MTRIAIVGIACRYPDAATHSDLWANVLAGRRAFRALPEQRMGPEYFSEDPAAPDRHYATKAAVIEGWEFDRAKYRISGKTFQSTDLTHWLALDTVAQALDDAGNPEGDGLEKTSTGVILGNTLTGEFSRASLMRLRWPYVQRTLAAALGEQGWEPGRISDFLAGYETQYKSAFAPITEDTLAGGLANTIAGRVCNYYDFGGGGYTVDGACSSSILAAIHGADALSNGHLDTAVVGGVDLSIDPFEVVGFAKTGALSTSEMRVYDKRSNGFWPGEGCGVLVLMREEDALAQGKRIYASLTGWGYSSDGRGGITRPEAAGHRHALDRAYTMAGYGFDTVGYVEGHGTGTKLGDETELGVFDSARRDAGAETALPIGTVKGNIGHTKAAAGAAGLIKAAMAIHHGVIPPVTGNGDAHPTFESDDAVLRLPQRAEVWPEGPRRAGVSSMGFGGINGHLALEGTNEAVASRNQIRTAERLSRSGQDAELLVVSAPTPDMVAARLREIAPAVARLSYAELADLSVALIQEDQAQTYRAAVVATDPVAAAAALDDLADAVESGEAKMLDVPGGRFLGEGDQRPRIGYLFPGQGAPGQGDGGAVARRFEFVEALYDEHGRLGASVATETAQPRIVTAELAGLRLLEEFGVQAAGCVGHSLGELTALHWAGAFSEQEVLDAAAERGRVMATASDGDGAMASLHTEAGAVEPMLGESAAVIAGFNGPTQTVVSGPAQDVDKVVAAAEQQGIQSSRLTVSHAFHSPSVAPAAGEYRAYLDQKGETPVERSGLYSTVTGELVEVGSDVRGLLEDQIREPVKFDEALRALTESVDLLVEVGPGGALTALAAEIVPEVPAVALSTDGDSLAGVLAGIAAIYVAGGDPELHTLVRDRHVRPIEVTRELQFFESPCEAAPVITDLPKATAAAGGVDASEPTLADGAAAGADALETLRQLMADSVELPLGEVLPETRPLDELHLSSITVSQIVGEAARALGVVLPPLATNMATATIADIAETLSAADGEAESDTAGSAEVAGAGPWVRAFAIENRPAAQPPGIASRDQSATTQGSWRVFGQEDAGIRTLVPALQEAIPAGGVVLRVAQEYEDIALGAALEAARSAIAEGTHFVTLDSAFGAAGLAKTLRLEHPSIPTTVVQLPSTDLITDDLAALIARDVAATESFTEVSYDAEGQRTNPVLTALDLEDTGPPVLGADDVVLVTGGAKGITVECALTVADTTGCRLALLGRAAADDEAVTQAMSRLESAGVQARYYSADVTEAAALKAAVEKAEAELGAITGLLHGAGVNEPAALESLQVEEFQRTLDTKVGGLSNVLGAVEHGRLKAVIAFGSIIGRAGLAGEAHYATANDQLRRQVELLQDTLPGCRCLTIEWSVWSGAGMGERLNVLDALISEGIQPIPLDDGLDVMRRLLTTPEVPTSVVVMGRATTLPTITFADAELPLVRFVERPLLHIPGVELIVEAELTPVADPYLLDHDLDGALLFPAVMGLEAMAQVSAAVLGSTRPVQFDNVRFDQAILVARDGANTLRIAAVVTPEGVRLAIRTSDTGFHTDHFTATAYAVEPDFGEGDSVSDVAIPLDAGTELYGNLMFQGTRFQVVRGYASIAATSCVAEIAVDTDTEWFGPHEPESLVLSSPAVRDAFMHAIQVCVPNATLLPAGVASVQGISIPEDVATLWLHADEQDRDGDTYWYDLRVSGADGKVYAEWRGLELKAVRDRGGAGPWTPELLGSYLERRLVSEARVALARTEQRTTGTHEGKRREATAAVLSTLVGRPVEVTYRPDGKPELDGYRLSAAHSGEVTLVVVGDAEVGCDLEHVAPRTEETWTELLGESGFDLVRHVAEVGSEDENVTATRVWAAREALTKAGQSVAPAAVQHVSGGDSDAGWITFKHGDFVVETFHATTHGEDGDLVVSVAQKGRADG